MTRAGSRTRSLRLWALIALFALAAAACSGSKPQGEIAGSETGGDTTDAADVAEDGETEGSDEEEDDTSDPTSEGTISGGRSSFTVAPPGEEPTVTETEEGDPVANLFKPSEDRVGITKDEIKICMHAAFVFGEVFNNRPQDEKVYWQMVNDNGGIYGRKVEIKFTDDQYQPAKAVEAADACKDFGAFVILGGIGFDQIPAVRSWAEQNRQLYFYTMATEKGARDLQFSFAVAPTIETMGRQIAQFVVKTNPNKKFAILARDSDNWRGATDAFTSEVERLGGEVAYREETRSGKSEYFQEINDMKTACPASECVAYVNENVLAFDEIVQQAEGQLYRPRWFNYGFNLVTDTLKDAATKSPAIQSWFVTPAFDPVNHTNQPWWPEIQKMKQAYEKYRPNKEANDVDWMFWLSFKALHKMLLDCGKDCSRNRVVGMLLDGYRAKVDPLCEANFAKGHPHFGAWRANVYEAVPHPSKEAIWKQIRTCQESFL